MWTGITSCPFFKILASSTGGLHLVRQKLYSRVLLGSRQEEFWGCVGWVEPFPRYGSCGTYSGTRLPKSDSPSSHHFGGVARGTRFALLPSLRRREAPPTQGARNWGSSDDTHRLGHTQCHCSPRRRVLSIIEGTWFDYAYHRLRARRKNGSVRKRTLRRGRHSGARRNLGFEFVFGPHGYRHRVPQPILRAWRPFDGVYPELSRTGSGHDLASRRENDKSLGQRGTEGQKIYPSRTEEFSHAQD